MGYACGSRARVQCYRPGGNIAGVAQGLHACGHGVVTGGAGAGDGDREGSGRSGVAC